MSNIDNLPLDLFGEDDGESPASNEATYRSNEPEVAAAGSPTAATSMRLYDAIGVVALTAVLGLALRMVGATFVMPLLNVGLALLIYYRIAADYRGRYYQRAGELHERFNAGIYAVKGAPLPEHVAAYRILYDVGAVVALTIAIRVVLWMTAVARVVPDRLYWTLSFAIAIGAYIYVISRVDRSSLHVWIHQHIMKDSQSSTDD